MDNPETLATSSTQDIERRKTKEAGQTCLVDFATGTAVCDGCNGDSMYLYIL
jgi:hypothetical protein